MGELSSFGWGPPSVALLTTYPPATLMAHSTFPTTTTTTSSAVPLPSCHPSRPTHEPTASLDLQPRFDDEMMASFIRSPSLGIREDTPRTTSSSTRTGSTNPLPPNQQAQQTRRPASLNLNKTPPSSPMASQIQPPTIDSYNSPSTAGPSQIHTHTEAGFLQPGLFSSPSNLFRPSASSNPPTPSEPSFRQPRSPVRSPNPIGLGIGVLGSKRKFSGGGGQVEIAKKAMKFSFGRSA